MKRVKRITCYTDYPFTALGDMAGQLAPVRHVLVISYDGSKYAKVTPDDGETIEYIKAGYLYSNKSRYDTARVVNRRKLERMIPLENSK